LDWWKIYGEKKHRYKEPNAMKNWKILIAEDDANIRNGLCDALESEGARPTGVVDGQDALDAFESDNFDLVILDVMMPRLSGYDACRELRKINPDLPVIMLTAKGEEIDKVVGLQIGADDYVTKPFGIRELFARIEAVMRRCEPRKSAEKKRLKEYREDPFRFGKLTIDPEGLRGTDGEHSIELTPRELGLIQHFHERPGRAISRDDLMNAVWESDYFGNTRTVDQHISQLRKKIEPDPANPTVITTVHGLGYRYEP
jgi:DNA-binding response OmpR family regulator